MGYAWKNYRETVINEIEKIIKEGVYKMSYNPDENIQYIDIAKKIFDILHPEAYPA